MAGISRKTKSKKHNGSPTNLGAQKDAYKVLGTESSPDGGGGVERLVVVKLAGGNTAKKTVGEWEDFCSSNRDKVEYTHLKYDVWEAVGLLSSDERRRPADSSESEVRDFPLGDTETARWTPTEICLVFNPGEKGERARCVIRGSVKPLERLRVDGEVYYRWMMDGEEITARVDDLLERLKGEGYIFYRSRAQDVLSAVASGMADRTEDRHATYGVYTHGDKLELCEDPLPVKDEQIKVWEKVRGNIQFEATPEDLQAYIKMMGYWHSYEAFPTFGLGLAAPFTPVLRTNGIFFPHGFNYAPDHDLGKSMSARVASVNMFGMREESGGSIGTDYRLNAHFDAIALPIVVEEADALKDSVLSAIKDSAESWNLGKRGNTQMTMKRYASRAVLLMTGNALPTETGSVLKRILNVRFDSSKRGERRLKANESKDQLKKLRPIGFWLERNYITNHQSCPDLLRMIEDYAREIESKRPDWESPQRPYAWAVVYFGLKIFEEGCKAKGVDWQTPLIEEFVKSVVNPVERSTWDSKRTNVDRFIEWFDMWCVQNCFRVNLGDGLYNIEVKGEDVVWKEEPLKVETKKAGLTVKTESVRGVYVTSALLQEYNKKALPEERISNLKELAMQAASAAGIPIDCVIEPGTEKVARTMIGNEQMRAAFVPRAYACASTETNAKSGSMGLNEGASEQENRRPASDLKTQVPVLNEENKTLLDPIRPEKVYENKDRMDDVNSTSKDPKTQEKGLAREACLPKSRLEEERLRALQIRLTTSIKANKRGEGIEGLPLDLAAISVDDLFCNDTDAAVSYIRGAIEHEWLPFWLSIDGKIRLVQTKTIVPEGT